MNLDQVNNFLDPIFEPKIKCSCAVDDFHGIENLISTDQQKLQRGFMAYRVVKPPIELEFHLSCMIELHSIKIWPKIDSLKSIGFEIFTNAGSAAQIEFCKVASHFNLVENGIQFFNNSICSMSSNDDDFAVKPFYFSAKNQLRKVQTLKVIIKQTQKCAPVLKRIEIWGQVSHLATKEQKAAVTQSILKVNATAKSNETVVAMNFEMNGCGENDKSGDSTTPTIPEAFLDAITYEIMALPMILPSGKIIDNSTLSKHTENEAKWGRVPSDPFTWQPYTEKRKPILDVHLKSQIDSFLLKNCNTPGISNAPRTVGSNSKRRKLTENALMKSEILYRSEKNIASTTTTTTTTTAAAAVAATIASSLSATHEKRPKTLDETIRGVLKIGKYTAASYTNQLNGSNNIQKCFQCCELDKNGMQIWYIITNCSHLICRRCLIDKNLKVCKCGVAFNNSDVNKYR